MPVAVFSVGCGFGTERFTAPTFANMLVVSLGVAISAYGEANFVLAGVLLQLLAICTESTRLSMTQVLLQRSGLKLNPITTLYYVAPCSLAFLSLPWVLLEAAPLADWVAAGPTVSGAVFLSNAVSYLPFN